MNDCSMSTTMSLYRSPTSIALVYSYAAVLSLLLLVSAAFAAPQSQSQPVATAPKFATPDDYMIYNRDNGNTISSVPRGQFADMNGDGLPDVVYSYRFITTGGEAQNRVWMNTANGLVPESEYKGSHTQQALQLLRALRVADPQVIPSDDLLHQLMAMVAKPNSGAVELFMHFFPQGIDSHRRDGFRVNVATSSTSLSGRAEARQQPVLATSDEKSFVKTLQQL